MNGNSDTHSEEDKIPITERSNKITENIDGEKEKIVEKLYLSDLEIFYGWEKHRNVRSPEILEISQAISLIAGKYVEPGENKAGIILSGCGTSGRIAFLISRSFNKLAIEQNLRPCYKYIISGGDHALMTSVESCEDDWNAGKTALEAATKGLDKVLYIGITCGLSAPFIGGQVEYSLEHLEKFTPYLLGFNLASQARKATISGTDKIMLDIAMAMEGKHCLLNPVVGPEPINGSSRMKGATATKMLLEAIFLNAHQKAKNDPSPFPYDHFFNTYKSTLNTTQTKEDGILSLIDMAGCSLVKGGCISYVSWNSVGIMSMIDAAECVPTFGANHDDVRSFLGGGYEFLGNTLDLSSEGEKFQIDLQYFKEERCPKLTENDTVIFIVSNLSSQQKLELDTTAESVRNQKVQLALIAINTSREEVKEIEDKLGNPLTIRIVLPRGRIESDIKYNKFLEQCNAEVCLKWVLNAVSTGAHILKGKVYKNCMIDLKLTNEKLFERGIRIVVQFTEVSKERARVCLLKSIYRKDKLTSAVLESDISDHVGKAGYVEKVVPLAFLLAKDFTVDSGLKMLQDCPIVRQCIVKYI